MNPQQIVEKQAHVVMARLSEPQVKADDETKKLEPKPASENGVRGIAAGPAEEVLPDVPEHVKRPQLLIQALHEGHEARKRFVAEKLRRGVEIENELKQAAKDRDERLFGARKIHEEEVLQAGKLRDFRCNVIESAFDVLTEQRMEELAARGKEIDALDLRLSQLRKALDADIKKIDPERKVTA